ncbi:Rpn family recombination-promoting nuclease/putative transposase [Bacillus cereus]|uniref:Rpn family recombination-promoting nuclease/putative transposase n=1 Tax=Bacillus cereus TaxID=1396 RepID=UPI003631DBED
MEKESIFKQEIEDWERLRNNKGFLRYYEAKEKAIKDRISEIETAEEKAKEKAKEKVKKQLVKNMIKVGISIENAAEAAGISIEEVNEILQK